MEDYSDIINMPHHVSKRHPQMSMMQRAAQFAPFAALTGYSDAIKEAEKENEKLNDSNACERMDNGLKASIGVPVHNTPF